MLWQWRSNDAEVPSLIRPCQIWVRIEGLLRLGMSNNGYAKIAPKHCPERDRSGKSL